MGAARSLLIASLAACLAACQTPYQASGLTGGYQEEKLAEDTYRVSFRGNGNTPRAVVLKYFLYRCAELTAEHGYAYFELFSPAGAQSLGLDPFVKVAGRAPPPMVTYAPGGTVTRYSATGVVRMYPKDILAGSATIFSARQVLAELGPEIRGGTPSAELPEKYRSIEGRFPIAPATVGESPSAPAEGGPVKLDDLKGLMR